MKPVPDLAEFLPGTIRYFDPSHRAGQPMTAEKFETPYDSWHKEWKAAHPDQDDTWAPFYTAMEWYLAKWLKECRISHAATDKLLMIPKVPLLHHFLVYLTNAFMIVC